MKREQARREIESLDFYLQNHTDDYGEESHTAMMLAIEALKQEPKTGRWIMSDDGLYRPICNNCGAHPWKGYIPTVEEATKVFKYCPHCGARMESEEQE